MGSPLDDHEHELVMAQLTAQAIATERLAMANVQLSESMQSIDPTRVAVSPGQLRLVIGA